MLCLVVQLRNDRYAIDVAHIDEIIPLVELKELPGAPPGVVGLIDYYGEPLPVCDLSLIAFGTPTAVRMCARIVIVWSALDAHTRRRVGLLVPRATDLLRCEATDFVPGGMKTPDAEYLGRVLPGPRGIVQQIQIADLLTPAILCAMLGAKDAA